MSANRVTVIGGTTRFTSAGSSEEGCRAEFQKGTATDLARYAPDGVDPGAVLVSVYCGGRFVGNRWVEPSNVVDVDAEARRVAEHWAATVPAPHLTIATAPPAEAVTGLASWFWTEGYRGGAVTDTLDAFGYPVEVRMQPGPVTWDFGDGTTQQGGFGSPYPQVSDIQHVYQHRSTSSGAPDAPFTVAVRLDLQPAFRVAGGPWEPLDPITVGNQRPLVVREIQAVITDQ